MSNTFAQRFWKDFEVLSLEYIRDQYKDTSAKCIHTSFLNDGGYDGSLSTKLTKEDAPFVHEVLSLLEAKLRTNSNITIHDFAASIIAAYNFSANILYVVSNMNFTNGTKNITSTFSNKVNLKIILIDGSYILKWLENRSWHSDKKEFITELISSIKNNANLLSSNEDNIESNYSNKKMTDVITDNIPLYEEKLFGIEAKKAVEESIPILSKTYAKNRLIIIAGPVGTGKTTVINNIGYALQQNDFIFNILDGDTEDSLSIRTIFLWVLKSLWGIDPLKIYTPENIDEFIELICFTADINVEENIKEAIREIFFADNKGDISKSDLYTTYLLRYLNLILEKRIGKNRSVLAFENLHHLEQSVFDFTLSLIRCLTENNVGVIIELAAIESKANSLNDWNTGYNAILYLKKYGHLYKLKDFEQEDAYDYLSENLPGLSDNYYNYMLTYIGLKPVFLKYAVNWLIINEVILCDDSETYYTVAKPDSFFDGITPDQNIRIIEDIIRYYQMNTSEFQDIIIELFEVIKLLNGFLSYAMFQELYADYPIAKILQIIVETGLFTQTAAGININHELVLTALFNTSLSFYQQCAAEKIYNSIDIIKDELYIRCKKADLLIVMKKWDEFNKVAFSLSKELFEMGEYQKSIKYLSLCRKHYDKLENKNSHQLLLTIYQELFAYEKIGRSGSQKKLFTDFQKQIMCERRNTKKSTETYILALEKLYETKQAGMTEQYNSALEMLAYAKQHFKEIPVDLYTSICYAYALIEKKYISLDSAVEFLKREKELLPNSIELDIEYQSHEAAKYLNSDPNKALLFYKEIVKYAGVSKKYNKSIGHAHVDIMNCYLLLEKWGDYEGQYSFVLEYLKTNALYSEEGRLYNLDGLYYWLNNDLLLSEDSFKNSQFYFGLVHNQMNAIISRINYIGLLIKSKKIEAATIEFSVSCELILDIFGALYSQIEGTKAYRKHREYIALLVLIKYGYAINQKETALQLMKRVPITALPKHVQQFNDNIYPEEVFSNTCILHGDIVTLTR